jgi:hypothetical protein
VDLKCHVHDGFFNLLTFVVQNALAGMKASFALKARQQVLMHPAKRSMLLKLMTMRALLPDDYVLG